MFGKKHTEEAKLKQRAKQIERKHTEETKSKKRGEKNPASNPVVVNRNLYSYAKKASETEFQKYDSSYVSLFIRRNPDSIDMFKVSKDFYKYCEDNDIKNITREMFETFTQVQRVS
jgi:hypothetical protein